MSSPPPNLRMKRPPVSWKLLIRTFLSLTLRCKWLNETTSFIYSVCDSVTTSRTRLSSCQLVIVLKNSFSVSTQRLPGSWFAVVSFSMLISWIKSFSVITMTRLMSRELRYASRQMHYQSKRASRTLEKLRKKFTKQHVTLKLRWPISVLVLTFSQSCSCALSIPSCSGTGTCKVTQSELFCTTCSSKTF